MTVKQKLFLKGHDPLNNGRKSLSEVTRENLTPFHLRFFNLLSLIQESQVTRAGGGNQLSNRLSQPAKQRAGW